MAISAATGTWIIGSNWPWPRMFVIDNYVLAAAINGTDVYLYELVNASNTWTATAVGRLGPVASISTISVASFGLYYLVAITGTTWSKLLERQPGAAPGSNALKEVASDVIPHGTAICNYKNQILIGGIKTNDQKWKHLGSCAVAYGGIGEREFDPKVDLSAGFLHMPWDHQRRGKIYDIRRLGENVFVYGDRGIEKLVPFSNELMTGFGQETVYDYGILGNNCAFGTDKIHCFIDAEYNLCINDGEKINNLGYRDKMKTLTLAKIIISYEPFKKFFYISDGTYCFVLTPRGLYTTHQCVTSIGCYRGIICGFVKSNSDTYIRGVTTDVDLGIQGFKTVESCEIGVEYITTSDHLLYGRMSTKYTYQDEYINLGWTLLNPNGIFYQRVTGRKFKVGFRGAYDSTGSLKINSMKIAVQFPDNRNVRGQI